MALFNNMTKEDFEKHGLTEEQMNQVRSQTAQLRKEWDDMEGRIDKLWGGALTRFRNLQNQKVYCRVPLEDIPSMFPFSNFNSFKVPLSVRLHMMRHIVIDDGTKSLAEQICEWNHKKENVAILNDWISLKDMEYFCEFYWKTHQAEPLPKFSIPDEDETELYSIYGNERREKMAPRERTYSEEHHEWKIAKGYARRGEILEACLMAAITPDDKDDYRAYLMGMRIAQQLPQANMDVEVVGQELSYDVQRVWTMAFEGFDRERHMRPCWSYRIDPDEHMRAIFEATKDRKDPPKRCNFGLTIDYRRAYHDYTLRNTDLYDDKHTHTLTPDYGYDYKDHRGNKFHSKEQEAAALNNEKLFAELAADEDFDMLTGFSKSTGKQIYPKYYDLQGNQVDYKYYPGEPWWGCYLIRSGQIDQDNLAAVEARAMEEYEAELAEYEAGSPRQRYAPDKPITLAEVVAETEQAWREYKEMILAGTTPVQMEYNAVKVIPYDMTDLVIAGKLPREDSGQYESHKSLFEKEFDVFCSLNHLDPKKRDLWRKIAREIREKEYEGEEYGYPFMYTGYWDNEIIHPEHDYAGREKLALLVYNKKDGDCVSNVNYNLAAYEVGMLQFPQDITSPYREKILKQAYKETFDIKVKEAKEKGYWHYTKAELLREYGEEICKAAFGYEWKDMK